MTLRKIGLLSFLVFSNFQTQASYDLFLSKIALSRTAEHISKASEIGKKVNYPYNADPNEIDLKSIKGQSISSAIGQVTHLTSLTSLTITGSQPIGGIPESLGNLGQLQRLVLFNNQLTGTIPESLGNLRQLQRLVLSNNQLTGEIPESLGNLENLTCCDLRNNQLSGEIPKSFGNLKSLWTLFLQDNCLSGDIPQELGELKNLGCFNAENNQLTGIYPNLFNISGDLSLRNNHLRILDKPQTPICVKTRSVLLGVGGSSYDPEIFYCFEERLEKPIKFYVSNVQGTPLKALENGQIYFQNGKIRIVDKPNMYGDYFGAVPEEDYSPEVQEAIDFILSKESFYGTRTKNARKHLRDEPKPDDSNDYLTTNEAHGL